MKSLLLKPPRVQSIPTDRTRFSAEHRFSNRKLLALIPLINGIGPTMAVAVDKSGTIVDGINVVLVLAMLGRDSVDVFYVDDATSAAEIEQLRRSTNSLTLTPRTDSAMFERIVRIQLDRTFRVRRKLAKGYVRF